MASARAGAARSAILLGVERVVRSEGAHLAIPGADALPSEQPAVAGAAGEQPGGGMSGGGSPVTGSDGGEAV